ncbi:MAG: hypothetical protein JWO94_2979 [Verrucomicrobiaceae bacterium]|nr:hypothetical protein [Verrucomicrobiaceae bacterium]
MQAVTLTLPANSLYGAKLPPRELESELLKRLAAALFSDGIVSGAAACRMAAMSKVEFQYMLGERGVKQPLEVPDYEQDMVNIQAWKGR